MQLCSKDNGAVAGPRRRRGDSRHRGILATDTILATPETGAPATGGHWPRRHSSEISLQAPLPNTTARASRHHHTPITTPTHMQPPTSRPHPHGRVGGLAACRSRTGGVWEHRGRDRVVHGHVFVAGRAGGSARAGGMLVHAFAGGGELGSACAGRREAMLRWCLFCGERWLWLGCVVLT